MLHSNPQIKKLEIQFIYDYKGDYSINFSEAAKTVRWAKGIEDLFIASHKGKNASQCLKVLLMLVNLQSLQRLKYIIEGYETKWVGAFTAALFEKNIQIEHLELEAESIERNEFKSVSKLMTLQQIHLTGCLNSTIVIWFCLQETCHCYRK